MIKKVLFVIIPVFFVTILTLTGIRVTSKDVIIIGNIKNAFSKQWVFRAKISIGEKVTYRYATTSFRIHGLEKGSATLKVEAPNYESQSIEIDLKRGENVVDDILLRPLRIPDLQTIYVFAHPHKDHFKLEIRLANSESTAILHAPHLPLQIYCVLYTQMGEKKEKQKGNVVYRGHPDTIWDYDFETIFPLSSQINYKDIKAIKTKSYVLDTKIVIPNESYSLDESIELFSKLSVINNEEQFQNFISNNNLIFFQDTTWDIRVAN
jgi:hypothetical protein